MKLTYYTFPLNRNTVTRIFCYLPQQRIQCASRFLWTDRYLTYEHTSPRELLSNKHPALHITRRGCGHLKRDSLYPPISTQGYTYARVKGRGLCMSRGALGRCNSLGTFTLHRACYNCRLFLNGTRPKIALLRKKRKTEIPKCAS